MLHLLTDIANEYHQFVLVLHLFAVVIGLGGATYTDILLVRFLRDLRIDHKESEVIHTISHAVFWGVALALVSGLMLFLADPELIWAKPKFRAKVIIFAVIMVNGYLLHRIILPKLMHFSFDREHYLVSQFLHLRHAGFIMGAISGVSWYSVFLLGGFAWTGYGFSALMIGYAGALAVGVVGALVVERYLKQST